MSEAEEDAFDQWAAMPDHLRPPLNDDEDRIRHNALIENDHLNEEPYVPSGGPD